MADLDTTDWVKCSQEYKFVAADRDMYSSEFVVVQPVNQSVDYQHRFICTAQSAVMNARYFSVVQRSFKFLEDSLKSTSDKSPCHPYNPLQLILNVVETQATFYLEHPDDAVWKFKFIFFEFPETFPNVHYEFVHAVIGSKRGLHFAKRLLYRGELGVNTKGLKAFRKSDVLLDLISVAKPFVTGDFQDLFETLDAYNARNNPIAKSQSEMIIVWLSCVGSMVL